jgi:hypothetical protein
MDCNVRLIVRFWPARLYWANMGKSMMVIVLKVMPPERI